MPGCAPADWIEARLGRGLGPRRRRGGVMAREEHLPGLDRRGGVWNPRAHAPTLPKSVSRLAERIRESWGHEELFIACLQWKVSARESHGGDQRIRAARFRPQVVRGVRLRPRPWTERDTVAHLGTLISSQGNVVSLCPPGIGKTELAIGLAIRACQAGHRVAFATASLVGHPTRRCPPRQPTAGRTGPARPLSAARDRRGGVSLQSQCRQATVDKWSRPHPITARKLRHLTHGVSHLRGVQQRDRDARVGCYRLLHVAARSIRGQRGLGCVSSEPGPGARSRGPGGDAHRAVRTGDPGRPRRRC